MGAAKDECGRILEAFAEAGGNFIDTADAYTIRFGAEMSGAALLTSTERS
jgi:aryl-alcohol dehydrogenase-like predicted oxidoreductase